MAILWMTLGILEKNFGKLYHAIEAYKKALILSTRPKINMGI